MRSYCRLKTGFAAFFLLYLILAPLGYLTQNKEIFPFFSWVLFAKVPNPGHHYDVVISKHNQQPIQPPLPYNRADAYATSARTITSYQFIQKMGRAHDQGRPEEFAQLNQLFQRDFLKKGALTYQLTRIFYDPVERWHGKEPDVDVIETFSTSDPAP